MRRILGLSLAALLGNAALAAETVSVEIHAVSATGIGNSLGAITLQDTAYGLLLTPSLAGLEPGVHGFHVHEKPSCAPAEKDGKTVAALSAGGHLDPEKTGRHEGPYGAGHLGDLPPLFVTHDGKASVPVLAPRLKLADVKARSLMVHAGGDNYSDHPEKLGGGGARMGCGVLP